MTDKPTEIIPFPPQDELPTIAHRLIDIILDPDHGGNIASILRAAGQDEETPLDRRTFWRWMHKPHFQKALKTRAEALHTVGAVLIDQALLKKMFAGDVPAIRLYMERTGQLIKKVEHTGEVGVRPLAPEEVQKELAETKAKLKVFEDHIVDTTAEVIDDETAGEEGDESPGEPGAED